MRRVIAAVLLVVTTACQVEATVGLLRDADVHHETAGEALTHFQAEHVPGDHLHARASEGSAELVEHSETVEHGIAHSHERRPGADQQQSSDGHEHGSAADHCTHVHGFALNPYSAELVTIQAEFAMAFRDPLQHTELVFQTHSPPPRA